MGAVCCGLQTELSGGEFSIDQLELATKLRRQQVQIGVSGVAELERLL